MKRDIAALWIALGLCVAMGINNAAMLTEQASTKPGPHYSGESGVALMFNVYQNTKEVSQILAILDEYGVKASFFIGGVWAKDNEETLLAIDRAGHDVGNHGYNHKLPTKVGPAVTRDEIQKTDAIISRVTGKKSALYAPPSGDFKQETVRIAEEEGYTTILWSADTIDWRDQNAELIHQRAMKLGDGGFLLMHPTPMTVKALPRIIEGLIAKGYEIKPVSEILGIDSGPALSL